MTQTNYDRRKRLRRQRARRKKRIRQTISISIFVLILIFIFSKIFSGIKNSKDTEVSPALMWYYTNEIYKDRPRPIFYEKEYISNVALDKLCQMEDEFIVKGSNHLKKVDKYAYDTKKIRDFTVHQTTRVIRKLYSWPLTMDQIMKLLHKF